MQTVEATVTEILRSIKGDFNIEFQASDDFITIYSIDSFDLVELLVQLEENYKIELFQDAYQDNAFESFGNFVHFIETEITKTLR